MKKLHTLAVIAAVGVGTLIASATSASATIACNGEGACWHVRNAYHYAPGYGVVVHPNTWRWGPTDHYTWREHAGRGYWRNGVWIKF